MADNNEKKIKLEEGEIMRISVRDYNPETGEYFLTCLTDGEAGVMVHAILQVLEKNFGMKCVLGSPMMGLTICIPRPNTEEGEKSEETKVTAEECQE